MGRQRPIAERRIGVKSGTAASGPTPHIADACQEKIAWHAAANGTDRRLLPYMAISFGGGRVKLVLGTCRRSRLVLSRPTPSMCRRYDCRAGRSPDQIGPVPSAARQAADGSRHGCCRPANGRAVSFAVDRPSRQAPLPACRACRIFPEIGVQGLAGGGRDHPRVRFRSRWTHGHYSHPIIGVRLRGQSIGSSRPSAEPRSGVALTCGVPANSGHRGPMHGVQQLL
jgi:hypothetical protein